MNAGEIFYGPVFLVLCCRPDGRACFAPPAASCQLNNSNAHRASQARRGPHGGEPSEGSPRRGPHGGEPTLCAARNGMPALPPAPGLGVQSGLLAPPCALPLARLPPGSSLCHPHLSPTGEGARTGNSHGTCASLAPWLHVHEASCFPEPEHEEHFIHLCTYHS